MTAILIDSIESAEEIAGALIALHDQNKLRSIAGFLHRYLEQAARPESKSDWLPRTALRAAFRHQQEQEKAAAARGRIDRVRD